MLVSPTWATPELLPAGSDSVELPAQAGDIQKQIPPPDPDNNIPTMPNQYRSWVYQ